MDLQYDNGILAKNKLRYHGLTPDPASERKPRCRLLNRLGNRCCNEAVSDIGLCAAHLGRAANEYRTIVAARTSLLKMPGGSVRVVGPEA